MDSIRQYAEEILEQMKNYFPVEFQDLECRIVETHKNNGITVMGLHFQRPETKTETIINIDSYFAESRQGWMRDEMMKTITTQVMECFKSVQLAQAKETGEYDIIKDSLKPVLINTKANRQLLKHIPHMEIEDLSVICRGVFPLTQGVGVAEVKNEYLKQWRIGKEQLFKRAFENMKESEVCVLQDPFSHMKGILMEEMQQQNLLDMSEKMLECFESAPSKGYVLTKKNRYYGAVAILCSDIMDKVSKIFPGGFYILPSSVHECMIVPKTENISLKELKEIVRDINRALVRPEEVLSDNVYEYDKECGRIRQAVDPMERGKEMGR